MRRIFIITALISLASAAAYAGDGSCVTSVPGNPNPCKDMSAGRIVAGSNKRVLPTKPAATQTDQSTGMPIGVVVDVHGHGKNRDHGKIPDKAPEAKP